MRCLSCDRKLNDYESTRRYASSGDFVDLCNRCFSFVADDIPDLEGDGFDPSDYTDETELSEEEYNDAIERWSNDSESESGGE